MYIYRIIKYFKMENQNETKVIHTEDYRGFKIEILLEKGIGFEKHKIIINGNGHTSDKSSVEDAITEARILVEDILKKKRQKKRKMS